MGGSVPEGGGAGGGGGANHQSGCSCPSFNQHRMYHIARRGRPWGTTGAAGLLPLTPRGASTWPPLLQLLCQPLCTDVVASSTPLLHSNTQGSSNALVELHAGCGCCGRPLLSFPPNPRCCAAHHVSCLQAAHVADRQGGDLHIDAPDVAARLRLGAVDDIQRLGSQPAEASGVRAHASQRCIQDCSSATKHPAAGGSCSNATCWVICAMAEMVQLGCC